MTKGRKPDPTRAARGTGNRPATAAAARPSRAVVVPPEPVESFPPPEGLPPAAHGIWRAVVADLGGANHMRESYVPAITAYCEAAYVHAQASANIHEFGILVKGRHGPVANPLLKVQKDAAATMLRYADALGLTPAGRIRLGLMEVVGQSILGPLQLSLDGKR